MTATLSIRPVRETDQDAIAAIADATDLFPGSMAADMMRGHLADPATDLWLVAECEGAVAGFVFCEPERLTNGTWNMRAIGVLPALQGQGIGAALALQTEALLREAGHRVLIVETGGTPDYAPTQAFYLAKGYAAEARIRDFWDEGADKLVFWRRL